MSMTISDLCADLMHRQTVSLKVGYDLDGVNVWFDRAYYNACVALGVFDPRETPYAGINQTYEFYADQYGQSLEEFLRTCHEAADKGLLWTGPMLPGAAYAWDALIEAGHEIHVKTDRSFGSHPVASEVATIMWLREHGRRYHSITFGPDKTAGPDCDVMLEDLVKNYDPLEQTSCIPYLLNQPWNKIPGGDDRRRVDNHDEFLFEVLRLGAAHADLAGV